MREWKRALGALFAVSTLVWCNGALAQESTTVRTTTASVPPVSERETITEKGGPSTGMLTSGVITFGISYGIAASVALSSERDSDNRLAVPFAGPWLTLANREDCGASERYDCDGETMNKVLIATDGVFQALGGILIIGAFLNPQERTVTRTVAKPRLVITPKVSFSQYGLSAVGTF